MDVFRTGSTKDFAISRECYRQLYKLRYMLGPGLAEQQQSSSTVYQGFRALGIESLGV